MDMKTTKKQVEWCLEHRPATRDCDMYLIMSVWKNYHRNQYIDFLMRSMKSLDEEVPIWMKMSERSSMHDLPSPESIRRTRQKIQNEEGRWLADEQIQKARAAEEVNTREWARS